MDMIEARVELLKLAAGLHAGENDLDQTAEAVLGTAKAWADFVAPAPPRESKTTGPKGADELRPTPTHVP